MIQALSIGDFQKMFSCDDDCRQLLFDLKWNNGYQCRRCGSATHHQGKTRFHLRCSKCGYDESITANTAFHRLKLPLSKAFAMCYRISVRKKGMSVLELAREFRINRKSSWLFKRKGQERMRHLCCLGVNEQVHSNSTCNIESGHADDVPEQQREGESTAGTPQHGKPLSGDMLWKAAQDYFGSVFNHQRQQGFDNSNDEPKSKTDLKTISAGEKYKMRRARNRTVLLVKNFTDWLRGIHHHCSQRFVLGYLDEFFFRYQERDALDQIWYKLIKSFMTGGHYLYRVASS